MFPTLAKKIENVLAVGNTTTTNSSASDSASSNSEQVHLNSATVEDLQN